MSLITIRDLSIGFLGPPLLDGVACQIESGQRIGLLGRNGSGKTTLLKILTGEIEPDDGEILKAPETKVSLLPQEVPREIAGRVNDVVAQGAAPEPDTHGLSESMPDAAAAWRTQQRVDEILSRMDLDGDAQFEVLSSGMKRRVLLARALVSHPDVLLLDEPTNHLDISAITWLEGFLTHWKTTLIFVTHDRMFLRKLATRILEIDRGKLFDWSCDYEKFLERKEVALAAEERQNALFDKKLAQEEAWIRQGIKARRTRNEGRVRALKQLRRERQKRQSRIGNVRIQIDAGQRSGNLVAEVKSISFAFGEHEIIRDFSATVTRGDKIGIIGPNGVGKTTLLRIILGELPPDSGNVRFGTNLQIAYFDQLREQLEEDQTVQQNVGDGADTIQIGGSSRHVLGYLQDFLFSPERARTKIRYLSGGERNRVLLARLFAKPANVIVLDEPTNDLDAETLELLEARLVEFQGTVLLVSHDRTFLNNVVASTIVFEEDGVKEYDGGYDDWQRQRAEAESATADRQERDNRGTSAKSRRSNSAAEEKERRLSFNEKRELDALPMKVEQLETEIKQLHDAMSQPGYYQQSGEQIASEQVRLTELETELTIGYERWEELEQFAE